MHDNRVDERRQDDRVHKVGRDGGALGDGARHDGGASTGEGPLEEPGMPAAVLVVDILQGKVGLADEATLRVSVREAIAKKPEADCRDGCIADVLEENVRHVLGMDDARLKHSEASLHEEDKRTCKPRCMVGQKMPGYLVLSAALAAQWRSSTKPVDASPKHTAIGPPHEQGGHVTMGAVARSCYVGRLLQHPDGHIDNNGPEGSSTAGKATETARNREFSAPCRIARDRVGQDQDMLQGLFIKERNIPQRMSHAASTSLALVATVVERASKAAV